MIKRKKIAVVFGTRPDTIKMAPVIKELLKHPDEFEVVAIATAQHRHMLDRVLQVFGIQPDYDLDIMEPSQTLARLASKILTGLDEVFSKEKPDLVLVQGDTSTTAIGSLAAFYRKIPVGHVEAGLRTNDKANPFPEEINRRITGFISDLHFAPTESARQALLVENTVPESVFVTGNTGIDALKYAVMDQFDPSVVLPKGAGIPGNKTVLVTIHRRENWGQPIKGACMAIKRLATRYPGMNFIFPVHPNPVVRENVYLALEALENVYLTEPLDYPDFVNIMAKSHLILTDSGGVQEEGPSFGVPVLVLRSVTERPDAIISGTVKLVGLDEEAIFGAAVRLLDNPAEYRKMANALNPYGDGHASERIITILENRFGFSYKKTVEFVPQHRQT